MPLEISMHRIIEIVKSKNIKEAFFGSHGFNIADEASIEELQIGYGIHPDGSDLSGSNEGDWQKNWVVIGTDTEVGDPFFVDTNEPLLPVYTAMHGMGEWDYEEVSTSLSLFLDVLIYLNSVSNQSFARINPDENTITDSEKLSDIENKLSRLSGKKDYWKNFIEQHNEWVEEFGI